MPSAGRGEGWGACPQHPAPPQASTSALPSSLHIDWGRPRLQPRSTSSLPVLLLLLLNKFPVSLKKKKKIHKTQFLEVNNSETSEKKQKLKPAQYQTDTQNMQVADAWLASRGSTRSLRSQGPLARLVWVSKPPQSKGTPSPRAQGTCLVPFGSQAPQPSPSCLGTGFSPRARSRESSPTVLSCQRFTIAPR